MILFGVLFQTPALSVANDVETERKSLQHTHLSCYVLVSEH